MSLSKRLFNLARAEITDAWRKLSTDDISQAALDEELARLRSEEQPSGNDHRFSGELSPEICRYYGNLELPIGASAAEVKAAYRRLMKRYHPDRHQGDEKKARVANQLAQELRRAYEALIDYHEGKG